MAARTDDDSIKGQPDDLIVELGFLLKKRMAEVRLTYQ
jgi:hypothetical protein